MLALAALVVWGVTSIGGGSSSPSHPTFASRIIEIGGTGSNTLASRQTAIDAQAIQSTLAKTPYIVKAGGEKRAVALTFDDGPSEWTPQILSVLRSKGVAATFFNVGGMYSTYGANSRTVHDAGYVVADHTWTHPQLTSLGAAEQGSEIDRTAKVIKGEGIPAPTLFRPPYGAYDQTTLAQTKRRNMLLVLWDVDTLDWSKPGADTIYNNVISQVTNGSIILMHDGGGDRSQTLSALPRIIDTLRKRGYQMVTVPHLLSEDPPRAGETPPPATNA
jgi:peptidoglycan/xylan/chitin deacetylase (PgdA/CDA1 family)